MTEREEFLAALTEDSAFGFNKLMKRHYDSGDLFNISDILEILSKEQISEMWKNLLQLCSVTLQGSEFDIGDTQQEELTDALQTLKDLTTIALHFVLMDKPIVTDELFQIVSVLHGVLLSLPEDAAKLQNEIAKLCEYWFLADFFGKEDLVCNTIVYLLARTHLQSPKKADLKRVWDIKSAFHLLDFEDESSDGFKSLMQRCLLHPLYLGTDMGKKILVFMFTLHPCVVEFFHITMKNAIPGCQTLVVDGFSEIYYQGWKDADVSCKEKIEQFCIQDLMFRAVHAKTLLFPRLESILMYFHKHKSQSNVDQMLYRLYQPILWRALKASNPLVRGNAATLLIDAFPLLDTSCGVIENDQQRQMQLDAVADLLIDDCPMVRAKAVEGVCKLCFYYWEYIPASTIRDFITKLTEELVFDSSSSEVRVAVFKGLKFLLSNRLSHALLKNVLPNLRDFVHDNSEKVRRAFLELLLAVKGIRSIKGLFLQFWSIVPLEHLLSRLEVESSTNCIKTIVKLLVNSYLPPKDDPANQLKNVAELMWTNRGAARTFFKFAHFSATVKTIANFVLLLTQCISRSLRDPTQQENRENTDAYDGPNAMGSNTSYNEAATEEPAVGDSENNVEINFTEKKLLVTMLEVLSISWISIKRKFDKGGHAKLKEKLINVLNISVPEFLQAFEDGEAKAAAILLASNLPPAPSISESCLNTLHKLKADVSPSEFGPIVQYLCSTGFASDVLDHLHELIEKGLGEPGVSLKRTQRKKGKGANNDAKFSSVTILSWILNNPSTRNAILQQNEKFSKLHKLLKSSMDSFETLLQNTADNGKLDKAFREREVFLSECLSLYSRFGMHLNGQRESLFDQDINVIDDFRHVFNWMEHFLLPKLDSFGGSSLDSAASNLVNVKKGKKRTISDDATLNIGASMLMLIQSQLILTSEAMKIGIGSPSFHDFLANFIGLLASHASSVYVLPDMMRISCDICQTRSSNFEERTAEFDSEQVDPVVKIMKACFKNIQLSEVQFPDIDSTQVFSSMKPYFTETIKRRFCSDAVSSSSHIPIMSTILSIVVSEIKSHLFENENLVKFESLNDLPTVPRFITTTLLKSKEFERSLKEEILFLSIETVNSDISTMSSLIYLIELLVRFGATRGASNELLARATDELQKKFNVCTNASAMETTTTDCMPSGVLDLLSKLVKRGTENST